jgi:hypothetical protein
MHVGIFSPTGVFKIRSRKAGSLDSVKIAFIFWGEIDVGFILYKDIAAHWVLPLLDR